MFGEKYTKDFRKNVEIAREAEDIAVGLLAQLIPEGDFVDVREISDCYHFGDFMDANTNEYYDVKEDSLIHDTQNVFVEDMKYWNSGRVSKGWMHSQYNYVVVLDSIGKNIYVLDFKILKELCDGAKRVRTSMGDNITTGFIIPLERCRLFKAVKYEAKYTYNRAWDCYDIV